MQLDHGTCGMQAVYEEQLHPEPLESWYLGISDPIGSQQHIAEHDFFVMSYGYRKIMKDHTLFSAIDLR